MKQEEHTPKLFIDKYFADYIRKKTKDNTKKYVLNTDKNYLYGKLYHFNGLNFKESLDLKFIKHVRKYAIKQNPLFFLMFAFPSSHASYSSLCRLILFERINFQTIGYSDAVFGKRKEDDSYTNKPINAIWTENIDQLSKNDFENELQYPIEYQIADLERDKYIEFVSSFKGQRNKEQQLEKLINGCWIKKRTRITMLKGKILSKENRIIC